MEVFCESKRKIKDSRFAVQTGQLFMKNTSAVAIRKYVLRINRNILEQVNEHRQCSCQS
jgi:hypothetical protein